MDPNPITYEAVKAHADLTHRPLSGWAVDLVMRIDDAVLDQAVKTAPKPQSPPAEGDNAVPVSDAKSMKGLFRGLMAGQQARKAGAKSQKTE